MMKKKGFTLIELIVVLAILAIIMAIAVPTAYGSIERTKDKAAAASVRNIASAVETTRMLAYTDKKIQESTALGAILYYADGVYNKVGEADNLYENYLLDGLKKSGISLQKKDFIFVSANETPKRDTYEIIVTFSKEGYTMIGLSPIPKYPYYEYRSKTGQVLKYKSAGSSEIIMG